MAKEYHIIKKNKKKIPSKKVMNLYYKEDRTTRPATIALYVLFIFVVMLAVAKVAVYDKMMELEEVEAQLDERQAYLDEKMAYLADYSEVSSKYSRYSFSYLRAEEKVCDRMEVLDMLEETVFTQAKLESLVTTENTVSLSFKGLNLEDTAALAKKIEAYEIVEKVAVSTASLDEEKEGEAETWISNMIITLISEEAGGEQ